MVTPPNYKAGIGRLVADRYDFQSHIDGYTLNHKADGINLNPALTIDGYSRTTVQAALTAALPFLQAPALPDATTGIKGIVQLAGDITGTATNVQVSAIRGKTVSTAVPATGQVLTWNAGGYWLPTTLPNASNSDKGLIQLTADLAGSATAPEVYKIRGNIISAASPTDGQVLTWDNGNSYWEPATLPSATTGAKGIIQLAGDITGTSTNVTVSSITGVTNIANINCNQLRFINTVSPYINQADSATSLGYSLIIKAQTVSGPTGVGGQLTLSSGYGSSQAGKISLQLPTALSYSPMLQIAQPISGNSVLSLVQGADITNIQMPTNTGNRVIYIANADTDPTASPVGGAILYSSSGKLNIQQSDGYNFIIGKNRLIGFTSVSQESTYANGSTWDYYFRTNSASYVSGFAVTGFIGLLVGDIVKATFCGSVGRFDDGYVGFIDHQGFLKLMLEDDILGMVGPFDIPGTETYVRHETSVSYAPDQLTITGTYIATANMLATLKLMVKNTAGISKYVELHGPASLRIEVLRP